MLHGWMGDENSMWVFSNVVPDDYWIFAPRAPFKMQESGYGWIPENNVSEDSHPFEEAVELLSTNLIQWTKFFKQDFSEINLIGFSQGGALSLLYSLLYPEKIHKIACLSGFIPEGWNNMNISPANEATKYFIAHGSNDDIVPIKKAYQTKQALECLGANVEFCEAPVKHRISKNCYSKLENFFLD